MRYKAMGSQKNKEIMRRNRVLKYLLEKEFKQMLRNPIMLPLIIALPLIQLILLPYAATYEIRNIQMVVVDHDQSSVSRALQQKIASSGYFEIAYHTDTYQEALTHIEEGTASMVLEIPENFEREMNAGEEVQLFVAADAVDGTKASIGTNYLNGIIQDFSIREREELAMKSSIFITEGDSASGTITKTRNATVQAVFSLRGKPMNCYKVSRKKVAENEELNLLINALGVEDDMADLRYNNIIVATDADDASHGRAVAKG